MNGSVFGEGYNDFKSKIEHLGDENFQKNHPDLVERFRINHNISYGGDWEFNEIVGYIKLYFMGTQVRGEYWSTKPIRKVKSRIRNFEYKSQKLVAECEIRDKTKNGILSATEEYLSRCKIKLQDRHIDLREFNALKDHLDWTSLHKNTNHFSQH